MTNRILAAGLLGGLAMYTWSFVAHMVLPLGMTGVSEIPRPEPVLAAMQGSLGSQSGLYLFPGMGLGPNPTRAEINAAMATYDQKLAANPSGLLIYHPPGQKAMTPGQLGTEFGIEIIASLLMAWLVARARLARYAARLGFATVAGLMAAISTNASYWNWYGFPASYTLAYMTIVAGGFVAAGAVAAGIVKPQRQLAPAAIAAAV